MENRELEILQSKIWKKNNIEHIRNYSRQYASKRIKNDIEYVRDEEQEKIDNMPDNLQGSEKYSLMEEAVSNLDDALSQLEDVVDYINSATE